VSDDSEKAFEATPRRIDKARREGNVARSNELAANCSFAAAGAAVVATAAPFAAVAAGVLARCATLREAPQWPLILVVALLPVACASSAGVLAGLFQNGGLALVPVAVKIERLNPMEGLRRILSRETLSHSLRAAMAFACATLAMSPVLIESASATMRSPTFFAAAAHAWSSAQHVAIAAGAVGLLFSIAEYGAARRSWLRKLRMSFEERKRELKEEEGDGIARGRRRSLHRALLRGGVGRVREADFVVVNPQHVAVALAYRPPRIAVPEVLVRAVESAAMRVRELAASHRIPVVEDAALARALYRDGRAGEPIPHVHYVAVAAVVAALMRTKEIAR
jgi:flagellar biosynthesis protein FlhB